MPHIIVRHSLADVLDLEPLLADLHKVLGKHETVKLEQTKTYAIPIHYAQVGDMKKADNMIHLEIRMYPGRDLDTRQEIAKNLHDVTRNFINNNTIRSSVSVEVHELDKDTYISTYN